MGEGPVSAGLGPPAVHPPASSAAASSAGDRRTDARVECPAAFMGESYPAFALARSQPRIWTGSRDGLEVPLMDPGRGRPDRGANNHTPAPMRWNRTRDRGRRRIHPSQDIPGSDPPSGVQRPECDHPVVPRQRTTGQPIDPLFEHPLGLIRCLTSRVGRAGVVEAGTPHGGRWQLSSRKAPVWLVVRLRACVTASRTWAIGASPGWNSGGMKLTVTILDVSSMSARSTSSSRRSRGMSVLM